MSRVEHSRPAAREARRADIAHATSGNFTASRSRVDAGTHFDVHLHQEDQLAWMRTGTMELGVSGDRSHLRGEHLVWIPAGMLHEMRFDEPGELISLYSGPSLRPQGELWDRSRILRADELATSILLYLTDGVPQFDRGARCVELLMDLLADAPALVDVVAVPRDPRARAVADTLLANPADPRELGDWAGGLGVSTKTIARAFIADTGTSFREWRIQARMHAAAGLLARGTAVGSVAGEVGYESVSSFIVAFKSRFGVTPARYGSAASSR